MKTLTRVMTLAIALAAFGSASAVYFSTYTSRSALSLTALGGDVVLDNRNSGIRAPYADRSFASGDIMALTLAPGTVQAASLRRNVVLNNSLILSPAGDAARRGGVFDGAQGPR